MDKQQVNDVAPTEEQFKQMLQEAVLKHYPNLERKDCLDFEIIKGIAEQRLPHIESRWEHISHCSPCYRVFLDNREDYLQLRAQMKTRRRRVAWSSIVTALGLLALATAAILWAAR